MITLLGISIGLTIAAGAGYMIEERLHRRRCNAARRFDGGWKDDTMNPEAGP